jgi:hypothetical protein
MRAVRNFIIGLVLFVLGIIATMLIPTPKPVGDAPWEVQQLADGSVKIFGIHLGVSNYKQAQQAVGQYGESALFTQQGAKPSVEAFFASTHLGGLSAKLVMNIAVPDELMQQMLSRTTQSKLQPSGARKHELAEQDRQVLLELPVSALTYIPAIRLDEQTLRSRFGEPGSIETPADETTKAIWYYPQLHLQVTFPSEGRTMLLYTAE